MTEEKKEKEDKGDEKKLIIEHRVSGLPPEKGEKTEKIIPDSPPTDTTGIGIEDFQKKMKELEKEKSKEIKELNDKVTELTSQVETGKDVKKDLEKAKTQLLALATKEFEKQKTVIIDVVKEQLGDEKADEVAEKITDVASLESAKIWINYLSEAVKGKAGESGKDKEDGEEGEGEEGEIKVPAGQATREPTKTSQEYESGFHLIDALTEKIMSRTASPKEKVEAEKKLDKLLQSLLIGHQKRLNPYIPINTLVARCPKCGREVFATDGGNCPLCGAKMGTLKQRTVIPDVRARIG